MAAGRTYSKYHVFWRGHQIPLNEFARINDLSVSSVYRRYHEKGLRTAEAILKDMAENPPNPKGRSLRKEQSNITLDDAWQMFNRMGAHT